MSHGKFAHKKATPELGRITLLTSSLLLIMHSAYATDGVLTNIADGDYGVEGHESVSQPLVTSNEVQAQVLTKPAYDLTIGKMPRLTIMPGSPVHWENTLTNTGNFDEHVEVKFTPPSDVNNFQAYLETDSGRIAISSGHVILLKAGQQVTLIFEGVAADTLSNEETRQFDISAVIQEDNKIRVGTTDSMIVLTKGIEFKDPNYIENSSVTTVGEPVHIEVGFAVCNANPHEADRVWVALRSEKTGDTLRLQAVETGANTGKYRLAVPTELNANAIADSIVQTLDGDNLGTEASCVAFAFGVTDSSPLATPITASTKMTSPSVISVKKETAVKTAEIGDFVDYTVEVRNDKAQADNVELRDEPPIGFSYVKNSVRVDGVAPSVDFTRSTSGKYMSLGLGTLNAGQTTKVTYRMAVEPTALSGNGVNKAFVDYKVGSNVSRSNTAEAKVAVSSGVLNSEGIIIGKVYADFNRDGIQQKEDQELGVAGVRVYLEDGTYAVTDSEGKYSFYGVRAKTHVIKVDKITLPKQVELIEQTNRHMGDPASRFVDLRRGELHRADFAITDGLSGVSETLVADLKSRAKKVATKNDALEQAVKSTLELEPTYHTNNNNRDVLNEGCKDGIQVDSYIDCNAAIYDENSQHNKTNLTISPVLPMVTGEIENALESEVKARIEKGLLATILPETGFFNLTDGQQLTTHNIRVQVKAPKGSRTELFVNDVMIEKEFIGKEVAWEEEKISGFDYFAIPLGKGANRLTARSYDSITGQLMSSKTITVYAPNVLGEVNIRTQDQLVQADGVSQYHIAISLKEDRERLHASTTPITIDADIGTVMLEDLDKNQAGIQTVVEGGELLVPIRAPSTAGKGSLQVRAGNAMAEVPLQFVPSLRPMIATGIIESVLSFDNLGAGLESSSRDDGFEEELRSLSESDDVNLRGRAALFLKGKVRGDYLLTLSYDSDKKGNDRLFRDIRPDEYYPVYGDASAKGFDAQSTSKLYVRVDKGRSFAMYGDIRTRVEGMDGISLGQYDRTLTGVKARYEGDKTTIQTFAAETSANQQVNETRGLGISGPYPLANNFDDVLVNSELVEVITRDKNNPSVILSRQPLTRFSDYEVDNLGQSLYLRAPIASQDLDGNPIYLRVTTEAEGIGEDYWIYGIAGSRKLGKHAHVNASYVHSDNPLNDERLASASAVFNLGQNTKFVAEAAQYESLTPAETIASHINAGALDGDTKGMAYRVELTHKDANDDSRLYYTQADDGFAPLSSPVVAGRTEIGANVNRKLNDKTKLKLNATRTEDNTADGVRQGASVAIERKITNHINAEVGVRYYEQEGIASTNYQSVTEVNGATSGSHFNQSLRPSVNQTPRQGTTLRAKVTAELPKLNQSKLFAEYEQDVQESSLNALSVGGETRLFNRGRLHVRHDVNSSLFGNYGLNIDSKRHATVVGIDANYMKDGQVFSEYRVADGMSSREAEAAIGLRNQWKIKDGVYMNTSIEHLKSLDGTQDKEATAATVGFEYLPEADYKVSGRVEHRWGVDTDTLLTTFGYAKKASDNTTLLIKNHLSKQDDNKLNRDRILNRLQLGMAYRDYDSNRLDYLTKLEYRLDDNALPDSPYTKQTYIASIHANYHPVRQMTFSGHYAGKHQRFEQAGINSHSTAHVIAGRALYDINERWDVGLQAGAMLNEDASNIQYLAGVELGYSPMANLWLSAGYNFTGYHDDEIASSSENQEGAYVRLRFKFDEDLFRRGKPATNSRLVPNEEIVTR